MFRDSTVFVAGGTSGINLGIAMAFAREGAKVAVLSRRPEKVDTAVEALRQAGAADTLGFAADVRDYPAVADAFSRTRSQWGELDVLVSGAAGNFLAPAMGMSSNAFKSVMDIDLLGTFHVMRAAFEHLRKPGASVINITAAQSWMPSPFQAHVCAAKAGVDQLTRTLAMEWGPQGVRVNSIAPGPIDGTEGVARLVPTEKSREAWMRSIPLGRFGELEDISNAALWLSSPQARYVTGVVLSVDGGLNLGGSSGIVNAFMAG